MPTMYVWKKEKKIIYVAEIVLSVPKENGKRKLETTVKAFADFDKARDFVNSIPDSDDMGQILKLAKIWEIEKIYENSEKVL